MPKHLLSIGCAVVALLNVYAATVATNDTKHNHALIKRHQIIVQQLHELASPNDEEVSAASSASIQREFGTIIRKYSFIRELLVFNALLSISLLAVAVFELKRGTTQKASP